MTLKSTLRLSACSVMNSHQERADDQIRVNVNPFADIEQLGGTDILARSPEHPGKLQGA